MTPEIITAMGVIVAAVITGLFQRLRRENTQAHGRTTDTLRGIADTVERIDGKVDGITEWQEGHERLHEGL